MNTPAHLDDVLAADVSTLSYEQARDGLVAIVGHLESGGAPLDKTLALWERGELLADRCAEHLQGAKVRLDKASAETSDQEGTPHDPQ